MEQMYSATLVFEDR